MKQQNTDNALLTPREKFAYQLQQTYLEAKHVAGISLSKMPFTIMVTMPMRHWLHEIETMPIEQIRELRQRGETKDPNVFEVTSTSLEDAKIPYHLIDDVRKMQMKKIPFGQIDFRRTTEGYPTVRFKIFLVDEFDLNDPPLEHYATCYSNTYAPSYGIGWELLYDHLEICQIEDRVRYKVNEFSLAMANETEREDLAINQLIS